MLVVKSRFYAIIRGNKKELPEGRETERNRMKTGLVMEGGAMRGMFTCGVIDVLMENGITFDGAVGVSAGAVFGCNYKSGQIGRAIRYNKRFCADPRYASFRNVIKTGDMYSADFCYRRLPYELDIWDQKAYEQNPMKFYCVCTDVTTGKAVYHLCRDGKDNDILWMRASASMPLVSRVVEIGDYKLLDGGIADSIPLRFLEHQGYDRNVVILTQPKNYIKKRNKLLPMLRISLRKYPNMVKAIANRHIRYNIVTKYIAEREAKGEIFVLRPESALNIGSRETDPNELERVYHEGRRVAESNLDALKAYLKAE